MNLTPVLEMAKATHTGMVRSHNEDSIATDPQIGLAVLADGMGGYNAGEVASGIATALISSETREALARMRRTNWTRVPFCAFDPPTARNHRQATPLSSVGHSQPQYAAWDTLV